MISIADHAASRNTQNLFPQLPLPPRNLPPPSARPFFWKQGGVEVGGWAAAPPSHPRPIQTRRSREAELPQEVFNYGLDMAIMLTNGKSAQEELRSTAVAVRRRGLEDLIAREKKGSEQLFEFMRKDLGSLLREQFRHHHDRIRTF